MIAGRLSEFVSDQGGDHVGKARSFELYRRNLQAPDVITFDELLARAEALVAHLERDEEQSETPASAEATL